MVDILVSEYAEILRQISIFTSDDSLDSETVDSVPIRKLFVSNLAERTTFKDLKKYFATYGNVESCYLCRNQGKNNFAFVQFGNVAEALQALRDGSRKQIRLHNRDLRVMAADSWHQPDSIEQQFYRMTKESDKASDERAGGSQEWTRECLQNDVESISIHMLNNDCLRHIFTFLPIVDRVRIELVCKRWRILSQESWYAIRTLDLSPSTWGITAISRIHTVTLRKVLLKCGKFLTRINLSESPHSLSQSTLTIIGKLCPNLTSLDVSALTTGASGLNVLANNCTNIIEFSLGPSIYRLDNDLKIFFKTHPNLEYVAINRNNSLLGKCLSLLPAQTIHTIILNRCTYVQDTHFSTALKRLENLRKLVIIECIGLSVGTLEVISEHCKNLNVLEFHGYFPLIQTMTMLYFVNLVNLQIFKVTYNNSVSNEFLVNMVLHCQQLACIDISGCANVTDVGLTAIATLPKLEKLTINYMDAVTNNGLCDIYGLKEFECRACPLISDEGISTVIVSSPQLQLLDLSGCCAVSTAILDLAKQICNSRSSNVMLKMIIGGSSIFPDSYPKDIEKKQSPFLQTVNVNMCFYDKHGLKPLVQ